MTKQEQASAADKDKKPANDAGKEDDKKNQGGAPLTESDIALFKRYGKGPYTEPIKKAEEDIKNFNQKITALCGIKESDTGLALPAQWNLAQDQMMLKQDPTLQVGRCTKILNAGTEDAKYIVHLKHMGKFVVGLDEKLAPTDVEEGMRVGTERAGVVGSKLQIKLPLPPKIDPTVTMMTVEDKPDVTYNDLGGCKDQIEKIREVVELPLLHPERFIQLGIDPPKGVLLYGPPGTGKTLTARAVANRTDATFIRVIGSELV